MFEKRALVRCADGEGTCVACCAACAPSHRTEWNWISVVVIDNTTTTELWFYKRGSSGGSEREAAPRLHCCCTPPTDIQDIHSISPPCCSVGILWRRRWRRSFHIARVAWSSSEPDVNTNGRTAMICMLDSAQHLTGSAWLKRSRMLHRAPHQHHSRAPNGASQPNHRQRKFFYVKRIIMDAAAAAIERLGLSGGKHRAASACWRSCQLLCYRRQQSGAALAHYPNS